MDVIELVNKFNSTMALFSCKETQAFELSSEMVMYSGSKSFEAEAFNP
jgi:hypothetical protein